MGSCPPPLLSSRALILLNGVPGPVEGKVRMAEEKPAYKILQTIGKHSGFNPLNDQLPHSEHPKTMSP